MSTPSILSAIQKLRLLLTRDEKIKWLGIVGFALCTSLLEVITASVIVVFAQVLTQPEAGKRYLTYLGWGEDLSPNRIVFTIALLCGGVYLFKNIVAGIEVFYQNFSVQKMNYHFKKKLLYRYAVTDYNFYLTRNSSLGIQVIGEVEQLFSTGMISLASIMSESVVFLSLVGMVVFMNPWLAIIIFGIGSVIGVIVSRYVLPAFYKWGQKFQEASLNGSQNLIQFFHAFKEMLLLGKKDAFIQAYHFHSLRKSRIQAIQTATNTLPRIIIETLFVGLFVSTIGFLCLEHDSPVQMVGILGGYLYVGFRLMPGLNRMLSLMNSFKGIIPAIERVYTEYTTAAPKENYVDIPDFVFEKSLILNDVSFRYLNTSKDALSKVSLEIKKGECIGVKGETGSGKSTLVDVILGLLKPFEGTVLVDGKYAVNSLQWHQKIGYVPQSIYLTDDTIEANIAFGETDIDHNRLQKAIDAAQLRNFVDHLEHGVGTFVGERGIRLSGGERQRIAIARALYRNPEVLIFDEATSALDTETEKKVMETIRSVSQNKTVIMIAHRLSTLKDCDRIVSVEKGKITETCKIQ